LREGGCRSRDDQQGQHERDDSLHCPSTDNRECNAKTPTPPSTRTPVVGAF
jgi:hypothetical protein